MGVRCVMLRLKSGLYMVWGKVGRVVDVVCEKVSNPGVSSGCILFNPSVSLAWSFLNPCVSSGGSCI